MSNHMTGIILVLISSLLFSTAGIFTKSVAADAGAVLFWRGIGAAGFTFAYLMMRRQLLSEIGQWDRYSLMVSLLMTVGTLAFLTAFKLTSVANVAVLWATVPFFAAFFAWWILGERPSILLFSCSIAAFIGAFVAIGKTNFSTDSYGDFLALVMTICMALVIVIYRKKPQTPAAFPSGISSVMVFGITFFWTEPMQVVPHEIGILLAFGLLFAMASVTMFEGARRISPIEVSLLGTLETPIAPILAFILLSELMTLHMIAGGIIVITAVVISQIWGARQPV